MAVNSHRIQQKLTYFSSASWSVQMQCESSLFLEVYYESSQQASFPTCQSFKGAKVFIIVQPQNCKLLER